MDRFYWSESYLGPNRERKVKLSSFLALKLVLHAVILITVVGNAAPSGGILVE